MNRIFNGRDIPHEDSSLTLIISAQAAQWFDLPYFYNEVRRTLKINGVLALFGYAFVQSHGRESDKLNQILINVKFSIQRKFEFLYLISFIKILLMVIFKMKVKKFTSVVIKINDITFHFHLLISFGNIHSNKFKLNCLLIVMTV